MGETRGGGLLPGTLDMLVLKALRGEPRHGYAIAQFIQQASDDVLRVEEGALYRALHRLELRGLLKAHWGSPAATAQPMRERPRPGASATGRASRRNCARCGPSQREQIERGGASYPDSLDWRSSC